jgi:hypothetical protein
LIDFLLPILRYLVKFDPSLPFLVNIKFPELKQQNDLWSNCSTFCGLKPYI